MPVMHYWVHNPNLFIFIIFIKVESYCLPWLKENTPDIYEVLFVKPKKSSSSKNESDDIDGDDDGLILTVEERLIAFYEHYEPSKIDNVPKIMDKYAGKEEQLFSALTKKYGPEPQHLKREDDNSIDSAVDMMKDVNLADKKKRRGASANKAAAKDTRVIIQVIKRTKKKAVTIVVGMDTVQGVKPNLKDVSQKFSRRFAGSSSVKNTKTGKEVIIQGDHGYEVAEFISNTFDVTGENIYFDEGGEFVPFA